MKQSIYNLIKIAGYSSINNILYNYTFKKEADNVIDDKLRDQILDSLRDSINTERIPSRSATSSMPELSGTNRINSTNATQAITDTVKKPISKKMLIGAGIGGLGLGLGLSSLYSNYKKERAYNNQQNYLNNLRYQQAIDNNNSDNNLTAGKYFSLLRTSNMLG